jgi:hypothetical protein
MERGIKSNVNGMLVASPTEPPPALRGCEEIAKPSTFVILNGGRRVGWE